MVPSHALGCKKCRQFQVGADYNRNEGVIMACNFHGVELLGLTCLAVVLAFSHTMDRFGNVNQDIKEIQRILRRHKDLIEDDRTSTLSVTIKVHENEQTHNNQHTKVMNTLHQQQLQIQQQNQQIQSLEAECHSLRNQLAAHNRVAHSSASNNIMSVGSVLGDLKQENSPSR